MANGTQIKAIGDISLTLTRLVTTLENTNKTQDRFEVTLGQLSVAVNDLEQTVASMKGQQMMVPFLVSTAIGVFFFIINLIQK